MNTFRNERYVTKEKKLVDTIKRHNIQPFIPKSDSKSNSSSSAKETVKNIDIARSRGFSLNEILTYNHFRNPLFDGEQTTKPEKSQIIVELEKLFTPADWYFVKNSHKIAITVVDFMSVIRKVNFAKMSCFKDVFNFVWDVIISACVTTQKLGQSMLH